MRALITVFSAALLACAATFATAQDRTRVVAVNYPLKYFAQELLGDFADVVFPVPAGVDPSFWRPSITDISSIQSADLILLNGAGFATWVDRVSLPRSKIVNTTSAIKEQYIVTESITHSHGDGGEHSHEGLASYTWLDPTLAIEQAKAIAAAVAAREIAPPEEVYARLARLTEALETLDSTAAEALASLQGSAVIATHPRYHYLARRYDLAMSYLEWEAGASPSESEMAALATMVEATGARVLIWEAAPPDEAFAATSALGLKNVVISPLAHGVEGTTFVEALADGLGDLAGTGGL